jgi:oxygen-dependent protoporphyrinogen oxidase
MRVAVAGGGMAGLACAYRLLKEGRESILLEASGRLGGKVFSGRLGGCPVEAGPDSFTTYTPWALDLVRDLGLWPSLLSSSPASKDVFLFRGERLRRFPEGLMLLMPRKPLEFLLSDVLSISEKLRMAWEFFLPPASPEADESLAAFARRRFGQAAVDAVVGPVLGGIFSGDPERLSCRSAFPLFSAMERDHGGVLRAMLKKRARPPVPEGLTFFVTLGGGGLQEIVSAMARELGPRLHLNRPVRRLRREEGRWIIEAASGEAFEADAVVLAIPAFEAAAVLEGCASSLSRELSAIPFSSTAVACLAYRAGDLSGLPPGAGFMAASSEGLTVTAASFSSAKFPGRAPGGRAVIRCFLGGAGREGALGLDDEGVLRAVRLDMLRVLGLRAAPVEWRVFRWPRANPQYEVGHAQRLERIERELASLPGLVLAGASYRGVGLPECARSGAQAARLAASGGAFPGAIA